MKVVAASLAKNILSTHHIYYQLRGGNHKGYPIRAVANSLEDNCFTFFTPYLPRRPKNLANYEVSIQLSHLNDVGKIFCKKQIRLF